MVAAVDPILEAARIEGWMSEPELRWLYETAQKMNTIAELGSWKGRSSYALASGVRERLYCVDTFQGSRDERETTHAEARFGGVIDQFWSNMRPFGDRVHTYALDHDAAAGMLPDVDMVFLDGAHDYDSVMSNIRHWRGKCRRLFAGHDLDWPGVAMAVKDSFGAESEAGRLFHAVGSIWFVVMEGK